MDDGWWTLMMAVAILVMFDDGGNVDDADDCDHVDDDDDGDDGD